MNAFFDNFRYAFENGGGIIFAMIAYVAVYLVMILAWLPAYLWGNRPIVRNIFRGLAFLSVCMGALLGVILFIAGLLGGSGSRDVGEEFYMVGIALAGFAGPVGAICLLVKLDNWIDRRWKLGQSAPEIPQHWGY
jgi:hypothetical protein